MIKHRLIQAIENKGIAKENFYKKIGMTSASFRGKYKDSTLNSDAIERIISEIPDLNLEWLITGTGPMFRNSSSVDSSFELLELEKELGELKDKYIRNLEELISIRKECFSEKKANRDVSREADK